MLTRKDFRIAANLISKIPEPERNAAAEGYATAAYQSNPRFRWETFAKACNLPKGSKWK